MTGASGGAILNPWLKIPTQLVSLDPCHSNCLKINNTWITNTSLTVLLCVRFFVFYCVHTFLCDLSSILFLFFWFSSVYFFISFYFVYSFFNLFCFVLFFSYFVYFCCCSILYTLFVVLFCTLITQHKNTDLVLLNTYHGRLNCKVGVLDYIWQDSLLQHVHNVHMHHLLCNAAVHVIHSRMSGQCQHTI